MRTAKHIEEAVTVQEKSSRRQLLEKCWPWIRRILTLGFFALIIALLVSHARTVDWTEVRSALLSYSRLTVALALVLAAFAFLIYSCYDLFGRHFIKSNPSRIRTMAVAFISFAFNLNLGAMVGSIGLRYRMYSKLGLGKAEIAHIVGFTVTTNWLGYLLLSGIAFASGAIDVPFDWNISGPALKILGWAFIVGVALYVFLCRFSPRRSWHIRGHELRLPSARIALMQLLMASLHWLLIGGVMYCFLYTRVDFLPVFGAVLVSAIAGAIAHIPGGLGVLEAVFIALLGDEVGKSQLFAALIAYRAVFYLIPLIIALITYLYMEVNLEVRDTDAG